MGVVQRQSAKGLVINLTGVGVGVLAMLLVYRQALSAYGTIQIVLSAALLLAPLASLGGNVIVTRYYGFFRQTSDSRGVFLTTILAICTLGILGMALIYWLLGIPFLQYIGGPSNNWTFYVDYAEVIVALMGSQVYANLLEAYLANLRRVTASQFWINLMPKIVQPLLVLLYIYQNWGLESLILAVLVMKIAVVLGLIFYLRSIGEFNLRWNPREIIDDPRARELFSVALYSVFGAVGGALLGRLDSVSLGAYVSTAQVGVYQYALFAASIVATPYLILVKLTAPQLAEAIGRKDWGAAEEVYRQVGRIMTFVGAFLTAGIIVNVKDLIQLSGDSEAFEGVFVAFSLLSLSRFTDFAGSLNGQAIGYSEFFRSAFWLTLAAGGINLGLNYLFIAKLRLGLAGAALATFLTLLVFNLTKSIYVYSQLGIQPLSFAVGRNFLLLIAVSLLGYGWVPADNQLLSIGIKSILVGIIFGGYLFITNDQPEIRAFVWDGIKRYVR